MKFIKLTKHDVCNEEYPNEWVNMDMIVRMSIEENGCTIMSTVDSCFFVKETPEEIINIIAEALGPECFYIEPTKEQTDRLLETMKKYPLTYDYEVSSKDAKGDKIK